MNDVFTNLLNSRSTSYKHVGYVQGHRMEHSHTKPCYNNSGWMQVPTQACPAHPAAWNWHLGRNMVSDTSHIQSQQHEWCVLGNLTRHSLCVRATTCACKLHLQYTRDHSSELNLRQTQITSHL